MDNYSVDGLPTTQGKLTPYPLSSCCVLPSAAWKISSCHAHLRAHHRSPGRGLGRHVEPVEMRVIQGFRPRDQPS